MEPVSPPLPLDIPMLLVKPPLGLSTPAIFKQLDLSQASSADPRQLLAAMCTSGMSQGVCINDLERPAFLRCTSSALQYCSYPSENAQGRMHWLEVLTARPGGPISDLVA